MPMPVLMPVHFALDWPRRLGPLSPCPPQQAGFSSRYPPRRRLSQSSWPSRPSSEDLRSGTCCPIFLTGAYLGLLSASRQSTYLLRAASRRLELQFPITTQLHTSISSSLPVNTHPVQSLVTANSTVFIICFAFWYLLVGAVSLLNMAMAPNHRRGPWVPEEDNTLIQLVHEQGPNNWVRISQQMQYRSPKQCRERFHQNLKPSLNHTPISAEEGLMIERMVTEMGKRWAEIARRLGNRSDNAVKNWWNGSMNRKRRGLVVQTSSRTCNGRIEAPYPRASDQLRRSSWSMVKTQAERSPVTVSHLIHDRPSSSHDHSHHLAPVLTYSTRHVEPSMTSPAFSEVSTLEPPSLVSDHNSVSSASPRTLPSPQMLSLPVDVRQTYVERRCSVPSTFLQQSVSSREDTYAPSDREVGRKWETEYQSYKPSGHHHYSNSVPEAVEPQVERRDSRMGLQSLLN